MNIVLRSGITNSDDQGKKLEEDGWVHKALEKEVGFYLEHTKENFMEGKKSIAKASTRGSQYKVQETSMSTEVDPFVLTMFLETYMKLLRDNKSVECL